MGFALETHIFYKFYQPILLNNLSCPILPFYFKRGWGANKERCGHGVVPISNVTPLTSPLITLSGPNTMPLFFHHFYSTTVKLQILAQPHKYRAPLNTMPLFFLLRGTVLGGFIVCILCMHLYFVFYFV